MYENHKRVALEQVNRIRAQVGLPPAPELQHGTRSNASLCPLARTLVFEAAGCTASVASNMILWDGLGNAATEPSCHESVMLYSLFDEGRLPELGFETEVTDYSAVAAMNELIAPFQPGYVELKAPPVTKGLETVELPSDVELVLRNA